MYASLLVAQQARAVDTACVARCHEEGRAMKMY
eukprot:CAMPEP_0202882958 /NCGR_PEP_ID=MMETSP1391-20130828/38726_1 /ASSEMBLY_ACC=CAM_ASM_000867 /TAXON_ID=1034604 /ORGANISM="Chlamydomonas leiostraca, Strain SAG 11-49" /LENGTH=32 /DNA_ID= /DNA_START= /DNA_END= /DNA_ORIENTATION=